MGPTAPAGSALYPWQAPVVQVGKGGGCPGVVWRENQSFVVPAVCLWVCQVLFTLLSLWDPKKTDTITIPILQMKLREAREWDLKVHLCKASVPSAMRQV
jgi:hypothetical protein